MDNVIAIIVVGFALFAIPFTFANLHEKSPRLMVGFVLALVFTAPIPAIGGLVFFFGFVVSGDEFRVVESAYRGVIPSTTLE